MFILLVSNFFGLKLCCAPKVSTFLSQKGNDAQTDKLHYFIFCTKLSKQLN